MAVIDREALKELGLTSGSFVTLRGGDERSAVARVWPSDAEDAGRGIVRIDGQLRRAADAGIDESVEVEPRSADEGGAPGEFDAGAVADAD